MMTAKWLLGIFIGTLLTILFWYGLAIYQGRIIWQWRDPVKVATVTIMLSLIVIMANFIIRKKIAYTYECGTIAHDSSSALYFSVYPASMACGTIITMVDEKDVIGEIRNFVRPLVAEGFAVHFAAVDTGLDGLRKAKLFLNKFLQELLPRPLYGLAQGVAGKQLYCGGSGRYAGDQRDLFVQDC